ncbi:MAG: hypothetical protein KAZ18_04850 [Acinetobacter sp.]|nr:hypothetical protein [Acinetobacter sp.]
MTLSDTLIILATALSPLIAVQVTQFLATKGEIRDRKLWIFKTLMATRAQSQSLSPLHVEALNRIDLEFSPKIKKEKAVLDVWSYYLDHMSSSIMSLEAWENRRVDLLIDLLYAMGIAVGYNFNKTQIKNAIYNPVAHERMDRENEQIRQRLLEVLGGDRSLAMHITSFSPLEKSDNSSST